jgi:hypothetical protein
MQWCVHDKHWSTWITLQLLFSIYINLQLPTYLNNFSIIKFTNVNNVSDINGWPLASNCPYGDHSGQRERLEIKYIIGLHQGEAKKTSDQKSIILLPFKSYSKQNKPSDPVPKVKHLVQLRKIDQATTV